MGIKSIKSIKDAISRAFKPKEYDHYFLPGSGLEPIPIVSSTPTSPGNYISGSLGSGIDVVYASGINSQSNWFPNGPTYPYWCENHGPIRDYDLHTYFDQNGNKVSVCNKCYRDLSIIEDDINILNWKERKNALTC